MTVERAVEVTAKGFAACKGLTFPYEAHKIEGGWLLKDGPGRKHPRLVELMDCGSPAANVVERARPHKAAICAFCKLGEEAEVVTAYKALGLRLLHREPMFVALTFAAPRFPGPVVRVRDAIGAAAVFKLARRRQILPEHLEADDSPIRLFAAMDDDEAVGMVRSVRIGDAAWVSNLHVRIDYRGRGLGRALMSAMLQDDARLGIKESVLLASSDGARLYPHLGYERVGAMAIFMFRRGSI